MKTSVVWKHELSAIVGPLALPVGAEILHVGAQGERIFLWERHAEEESRTEERRFHVVGTGTPFLETRSKHIGSLFMESEIGGLVWHVFEEPR